MSERLIKPEEAKRIESADEVMQSFLFQFESIRKVLANKKDVESEAIRKLSNDQKYEIILPAVNEGSDYLKLSIESVEQEQSGYFINSYTLSEVSSTSDDKATKKTIVTAYSETEDDRTITETIDTHGIDPRKAFDEFNISLTPDVFATPAELMK